MSVLLNRLHAASPVWLQNVALSAYGYHVTHQRRGGEFRRLLGDAMRATLASPDELAALRKREWNERLRPIVASIPAYEKIRNLEDVSTLPVLTKAMVRDELDRFTNPAFPRSKRVNAHTSGTTGTGLRFYATTYAQRRQWAYWWRYRKWHGIELDEWCGIFGGRTIVPPAQSNPPFWRVNSGAKSVMFSQYHLTPERARSYLDEIRARRLRWLHGYPSVLALLAGAGIELELAGSLPMKWITCGAENLLASQRAVIERMFGVRVREHYGLAEGVANISECPEGRLHVDEDFSLVELRPREDGGEGHRIIGTTLDNEAMPLFRYDTGDIALLPPDGEKCACGRAGRLIAGLDGRKEDYLLLSDGSRVGRIDHLFKDAVNVLEVQVVQQRAGEAVFRIVRGREYETSDERALLVECRDRFADRLRVSFDYVDELPRTSRGKLRLVVSEIEAAKLDAVV